MRALRGRIPRALKSHKSREGRAYGAYTRALLKRLGPLGPDAMPTLREAGLCVLDLQRVRSDLETARLRKRRQDLRRLGREAARLRHSLLALERRLEELSGQNGAGEDLARKIARLQRESP